MPISPALAATVTLRPNGDVTNEINLTPSAGTNYACVDEEVSDEDRKSLKEYDIKYALVRFLYIEKSKADGKNLVNFHFTPGDSFMDTPIFDVVDSLLEFSRKIESGEIESKPLSFDDLRLRKSNPPDTGKTKTKLVT